MITKKEFAKHCKNNKDDFRTAKQDRERLNLKLERLMPLVDLIKPVKEIIENQKAMSFVGKKIMRIIGYAAAIFGLFWLMLRFWKEIK